MPNLQHICAISALLSALPASALAAQPLHLPWACGERYVISQGHQRGSHKGFGEWAWDADMPVGAVVTSPAAGVIRAARDDSREGGCSPAFAHDGNYAIVAFADGTEALLLHLAPGSLMVKPGQRVRAGDPIGKIGMTGWTCGAHLHFQLQETCGSWWCQSIPGTIIGVGDPTPGAALISESCPGTGEGQIVEVQTPSRMERGQRSAEVTVRIRNAGEHAWTPDRVAIVSAGPNTLSWELPDGALCPVEEGCALPILRDVAPGHHLEYTWRVAPGAQPPQLAFRLARQENGTWSPMSDLEVSVIALCEAGERCEPPPASQANNPAPRAEGGCAAPGAAPLSWMNLLALLPLLWRRRCARCS